MLRYFNPQISLIQNPTARIDQMFRGGVVGVLRGMAKASDTTGKDFLCVGPQNPDGTFPFLRHTKDHEIQVGGLDLNVKDGQPIKGDLVHLTPRAPGVFDVEELYSSSKGPAMVNSPSFRDGWDRIYGNKDLN